MRNLLTFFNLRATIYFAFAEASAYLGVAQLVARNLGVVEAARSSRVTQTKKPNGLMSVRLFLFFAPRLERAQNHPKGVVGFLGKND